MNSTLPPTAPSTELRKQGGRWLRDLRERRNLTQKDLADLVEVKNSVFISQLENGRVRIPPERYEQWAAAYGLSAYEFVKTLLSFFDPITFRLLFEIAPADGGRGELNGQTAILTDHASQRYIDALYSLLGKKTAELESLRQKIGEGKL
jgi:transcriptional regulator with XRE-family HTH domain